MRKLVLTSHINLGGTKASVFVGSRPLATIYRADGAWNAMNPMGSPLLPRIPHSPKTAEGKPMRDQRGREIEISLGQIILKLRETIEAKLNRVTA
jgi:hypothetical protein